MEPLLGWKLPPLLLPHPLQFRLLILRRWLLPPFVLE
jgi:hypothetical protein